MLSGPPCSEPNICRGHHSFDVRRRNVIIWFGKAFLVQKILFERVPASKLETTGLLIL